MSLLRRKAELSTETNMPAVAPETPQEPPPPVKRSKSPAKAQTTRREPHSAAGDAPTRFLWTEDLDARLLELHAVGHSIRYCAERLSKLAGRPLSSNAINCRLSRLRAKGLNAQQPSAVPPSEQPPKLCEPPKPRTKRRTPAPKPPPTEDLAAEQIARIKRSPARGEWRETDDHLLTAGIIMLVNDAEARTGKPREWIRGRIAELAQEVST